MAIRKLNNECGFTLIELIASLVIVGIIAAMAGFGIVNGVQAYLFARENAPTAQKAQIAMTHLSRELSELSNITAVTGSSIVYSTSKGDFAIGYAGNSIRIISGTTLPTATTGDPLIDNISSFTLTLYKGAVAWTISDSLPDLTMIKIDFTLNRSDSGSSPVSFSTQINPRNTGNYNGPKGL